jgi:hypothetical protein
MNLPWTRLLADFFPSMFSSLEEEKRFIQIKLEMEILIHDSRSGMCTAYYPIGQGWLSPHTALISRAVVSVVDDKDK